MNDLKLSQVVGNLNCTEEQLPFIYFELPQSGHSKFPSFWQPMVDIMTLKLEKWKRINLSGGGRLNLCYRFFLLFRFSIYRCLPKLVWKWINFFWRGKRRQSHSLGVLEFGF